MGGSTTPLPRFLRLPVACFVCLPVTGFVRPAAAACFEPKRARTLVRPTLSRTASSTGLARASLSCRMNCTDPFSVATRVARAESAAAASSAAASARAAAVAGSGGDIAWAALLTTVLTTSATLWPAHWATPGLTLCSWRILAERWYSTSS